MNIQAIESLMYQLSDLFLAPTLILLVLLFAYSLYALGKFSCQAIQRRKHRTNYISAINNPKQHTTTKSLSGFLLAEHFFSAQQSEHAKNKSTAITKDRLDVIALEDLEGVRSVSRLAPMLGLIATMIPMGPALKSLADGNVQGISENLIVAFSAVIFGLVIASITFWIAGIKKRWLATELVDLTPLVEEIKLSDSEALTPVESEREAA